MLTHKSPISGVATFSQRWVATAGYDNRVILWKNGHPIAVNHHDHLVNACQFHPSGRFVVSASSDGTARIWKVPSLEPVATLFGHQDDVEVAVFSPDGNHIATASRDGAVRIYEFSGRLLGTLRGHEADVTSVTWLADGKHVISSSDDGTLRRWSVTDLRELEQIQMDGVETDTVVVTRDEIIFSGNDNGEIVITRDGRSSKISAHAAGIKRLVLSEDGTRLLSLSYDRHLCVFEVRDGALYQICRLRYPSLVWARSASFVDSSTIVFGTFGTSYAILDLPSGDWQTEHVHDTPGLNTVQATPIGLVSVGDSGTVQRHGIAGNQAVTSFGELCNFVCSHEDRLFVGGQTGRIYVLPERKLFADLGQPLNCAVSNGRNFIVGSYTGEIIFLDSSDGHIIHRRSILRNAIKSIAIHGDLALAVGAARDLCWFDAKSGEVLSYNESAHDKIANGCAHLSGPRFVSVSRDRFLRIFQYGTRSVEKILTPLNHSAKCVATDGRRIAVGSYGGQVAIYDSSNKRWTVNERPTRAGISAITYDCRQGAFFASSYDGQIYSIR